MKKLIFLLLLLPALVNAQSWQPSGARTPYRSVTNGASFLGKGAGTIESPLQWDVAISQPDTTPSDIIQLMLVGNVWYQVSPTSATL